MTSHTQKIAVYRHDDHELLGYITEDTGSWLAQTIFGYTIERTVSREAAEAVVQERGLSFLTGVWQYFDTDDHAWFSCVLKEANQRGVTVLRTNEMGFQDPDDYKTVTLVNPTDENLIKS